MSNFESKEQYLNYISAWKSATNAEECKAKRIVCDHYQYNWSYPGWTDEEKARFEEKGYDVHKHYYVVPNGGHCKEEGWLTAEHYIFHNMMRGKDPKRGFSPRLKRKSTPGETPWHKFVNSAWNLERIIKDAANYIDDVGQGKDVKSRGGLAKKFLEPFAGEVSMADLLKCNAEELAEARTFHR